MTSTVLNLPQDTVYGLARSAQNLYAARASGLYRSQDGGVTWQDRFAALDRPEPLTVTAVAAAGETVFAGVNGAVLRSDDAGEGWQIVGLASPPPLVVALAVSPQYAEDGIVAAGTAEDGVFISSDHGRSWVPWNFGLVDRQVYALVFSPDFATDGTIFAGTESGVFRSHNRGRAWRDVPFPMEAAPVLSLAVSPTYGQDGRLYAGTEKNGLFVSHDFGLIWRQIGPDEIPTPVNAIQIVAQPAVEIWLLLDDSLIASSDGGSTWQRRYDFPANKLAITLLCDDVIRVGFADGDVLPMR